MSSWDPLADYPAPTADEAVAPDGIAEAFSGSGGRVVGVQWHPEMMRSRLDRTLFENLARAA